MINDGATALQTYHADPRPLPVPHPGEPRASVIMSLSIRYTPAKEAGCFFCSMLFVVLSRNSPILRICSVMGPPLVLCLPYWTMMWFVD